MPTPYETRRRLLRKIESERQSKAILFVTGDRPTLETRIARDSIDLFTQHLDKIGVVQKITLVLYTPGGDTLAAWNLVNLLRMFCDDLEVLIPRKALSAGTLVSLGANRIIMTKQATLGPIDPSIDNPLNPIIPGTPNVRAPVSVEAINGYLSIAKEDLGIRDEKSLADLLSHLSDKVHPLVLGTIVRSRKQIQFLAGMLLANQVSDKKAAAKIIEFLCSESGSHDYTINRREARQMGLNIEVPSQKFYDSVIRPFHQAIIDELELNTPVNPQSLLNNASQAPYTFVRCLLESVNGGSHTYISEGSLSCRAASPAPGVSQMVFDDQRHFDGWRRRT